MTAQIKLKHSGGNGVIIEAPASNPASDKTIALPSTESGVFATKDSANSLQNVTGINGGQLGNRNLIINGAMQVAARGTSATGKTTSGVYSTDRINLTIGNAGTWTVSQDSDSPNEFAKSTKFQCTTANASLGTGAFLLLGYRLEGHDVQSLAKGTSSAKTFTVSFHVKSNKTGTYVLGVNDRDNSRNNSKPYTINVANTWEKKTITFEADTSGALDDDANESLRLDFWLAAGTDFTSGSAVTGWESTTNANRAKNLSVNLADNTANNWYITGLQLEVGSVATDFEHRSFAEELDLCQRYFTQVRGGIGVNSTTAIHTGVLRYKPMRANPSISKGTGSTYNYGNMINAGFTSTATPTFFKNDGLKGYSCYTLSGFTSLVQGDNLRDEGEGTSATFDLSAEL
tara:strand:- start:1400 stop:2602 length:1203 start_codon:yes stop_codon:yes gene_type:complete